MAWTFVIHLQAALGGTVWSTALPPSPPPTPSASTMAPVVIVAGGADLTDKLCLALHDVFIALLLVLLILLTIFGNVLVVLSVFVYKRMRTFTNILLTSLATADLLVGLVVMPLSLLDLLHSHQWPFGRFLCSIWATTDVLLCTASIVNLCIISLDRYMAITSPLKYPRTRSRTMAAFLLSAVWLYSLVVCTPPWFVPTWNLFTHDGHRREQQTSFIFMANGTLVPAPAVAVADNDVFICAYSTSPAYRIYSAFFSFYLPLLVMLFVYFKIFRVASEREALMRQSIGTCRLSNRIVKTQAKNMRHNPRCASAPIGRNRLAHSVGNGARANYSMRPSDLRHTVLQRLDSRLDSCDDDDDISPPALAAVPQHDSTERETVSNGGVSPIRRHRDSDAGVRARGSADESARRGSGRVASDVAHDGGAGRLERECHSLADLADRVHSTTICRKNTDERATASSSTPEGTQRRRSSRAYAAGNGPATTRLQPANLMAKAHEHYQTCGPGKAVRGSKEKMVYLRERKALKTIGIVVLGFIVCWMPFFVLYLLEVYLEHLQTNLMFRVLSEFFLWLGYSNSVLNPIIYTMYNGDFRRCFRDLLSFGCIQHHRRTMSVKKLHQQSTIF